MPDLATLGFSPSDLLGGLGPLVPVPTDGSETASDATAPLPMDQPMLALQAAAEDATAAAEAALDLANKEDPRNRPWTDEEDATVRLQVDTHGTKCWSLIAASLTGRTGKQCRERWHNQLDPAIKKDNWTAEEDRTLLDAHRTLGNR